MVRKTVCKVCGRDCTAQIDKCGNEVDICYRCYNGIPPITW